MESFGVGVPWYRPSDFDRIKSLLGQPDSIPATYEQWLIKVNKVIDLCERSGQIPIKVTIDPDELIAWCRIKNIPLDRIAQNLFASEVAKTQFESRN